MVNYSIVMRGNPMDSNAPQKAYATTQYAEVTDINQFAEHISSHGCVYKRADIVAILTMAVDCMREQLLAGQKIRLGDLGDFSLTIHGSGAPTAHEYNPAIHVKKLNVLWTPGPLFKTLLEEAVFNLVPTRKAARQVVKALKEGKTTVDLNGGNTEPDSGGGDGPETTA